MYRYIKLVLFSIIWVSCGSSDKKANDIISIAPVESELSCRACPGFIVVKRTQTSDTIFSGTWGKPNNHKIYTVGQDSFLIIEGEDSFPMGHRIWSFRVYDINISGELKCIFNTHFTTYQEKWFDDDDYIITEAKTRVDYSSDTIIISLNEKYKIPKDGKDPLAQKVLHEDDKELVFLLPKHH